MKALRRKWLEFKIPWLIRRTQKQVNHESRQLKQKLPIPTCVSQASYGTLKVLNCDFEKRREQRNWIENGLSVIKQIRTPKGRPKSVQRGVVESNRGFLINPLPMDFN